MSLTTSPVYNLARFSFTDPKLANPSSVFTGVLDRANNIVDLLPNAIPEDLLFNGNPVDNIGRKLASPHQQFSLDKIQLLRPLTKPEVWGAGVTYENSKWMREHESGQPGFYAKVYIADRPELFGKGSAGISTSSGPNEKLYIPGQSKIALSEAELVFVISPDKKIVGYTIGNDFTATDIEAQNPLYLPQAKIFKGCFGFGPSIIVGMDESQIRKENIKIAVVRSDGSNAFIAETNIGEIRGTFQRLIDYLFDDGRGEIFTNGVLLSSGTGVVMAKDGEKIPHQKGDVASITIPAIGTLVNSIDQFI